MSSPTPASRTSPFPSEAPAAAPAAPAAPPTRHGELTTRSAWWFLAATFAVTWGLGMLTMLFLDPIESLFDPMGYTNPVFALMVYSPAFVAVSMIWRHHGPPGLVTFLRRLTLWRMGFGWWALLLVGMPAVFYAGAAVNGNAADLPFDPWYGVLLAIIPALFVGPIEELGWRGVALPLLQRRFAALWSALIVGAVAAIWHTPALLMSGTKQSAWSSWPFFLGVVVVAVAVVVANRRGMLSVGAGATDVLVPEGTPRDRPPTPGARGQRADVVDRRGVRP